MEAKLSYLNSSENVDDLPTYPKTESYGSLLYSAFCFIARMVIMPLAYSGILFVAFLSVGVLAVYKSGSTEAVK